MIRTSPHEFNVVCLGYDAQEILINEFYNSYLAHVHVHIHRTEVALGPPCWLYTQWVTGQYVCVHAYGDTVRDNIVIEAVNHREDRDRLTG